MVGLAYPENGNIKQRSPYRVHCDSTHEAPDEAPDSNFYDASWHLEGFHCNEHTYRSCKSNLSPVENIFVPYDQLLMLPPSGQGQK